MEQPDAAIPGAGDDDAAPKANGKKRAGRIWFKAALAVLAAPFVLALLAFGFINTPIGKRFVADRIATYQTDTGLSVAIGRIEGNLLGRMELFDVDVKDQDGAFVTIPEATLDWRPFALIWDKLDIRELAVRRGRVERLPELLPGDPDAPTLPEFAIRIDRLEIDNFTLAPGVSTEAAQRIDITGKADVRAGKALVQAAGTLGQRDRIALLLDTEPDRDKFDLALDYVAPADGVVAGLAGVKEGYRAKIAGEGSWSRWVGHALVERDVPGTGAPRERVAAVRLTNRAGTYGLVGEVYPGRDNRTLLGRATGATVALLASGTFADNTFDGSVRAISDALDARGQGAIDLSDNRVRNLDLTAQLRDPTLFGDGVRLEDARVAGVLNGAFDDLMFEHTLSIGRLQTDFVAVTGLTQRGTARYDGRGFTVPLAGTAQQVVTGNSYADPILRGGSFTGRLAYAGTRLTVDAAAIRFPEASGTFALSGDTARGDYTLAGPLALRRFSVDGFGLLSGTADLRARFGPSVAWSVGADLAGRFDDVANETVADLAGRRLDFTARLGLAGDRPIVLDDVVLDSQRLKARFNSRIVPGSRATRTTLVGTGRHIEYGRFTFDAALEGNSPRAVLVFADPYAAAGLKDVRVALAPAERGFALDVSGQSLLGQFDGALGLELPARAPTVIAVERLTFDQIDVAGALTLQNNLLTGELTIAGGGLDGTLALAPGEAGAQGFGLKLAATGASLAGETPISVRNGDIDVTGSFRDKSYDLAGDVSAQGLDYGELSIERIVAKLDLVAGAGTVRGSLSGQRADRFNLGFDAELDHGPIALLLQGNYDRRSITMPRRAMLTPQEAGGYRLAPAQLNFGEGFAILEGAILGPQTDITARLSDLPLRLADLVSEKLALGGLVSGIATYRFGEDGPPTGDASLRIANFNRAGLLVSSQPIDVTAQINLRPDDLAVAARLSEGGAPLGQLDASITRLGPEGTLIERLQRGRLDAALEFDGQAEALWRLAAVDVFDLTGPLKVAARAGGTLAQPQLSGTLAGEGLRLQSAISGTDIAGISARGRFEGSRLRFTQFAGTPTRGGSVSGSGTVDFANLSDQRGPQIDLRIAARAAPILAAAGLDATLTGPLRIVSDGVGGTIAGKVTVDRASWRLGIAQEEILALPRIATTEINRRDGVESVILNAGGGDWQYLVDATAPAQIDVDGLGIESVWSAAIRLRGSVSDPRIGGTATLERGTYTFAGTRFELVRGGKITFDPDGPINPQLDIDARTTRGGTDVSVAIEGRSQRPSITLSSEPALPQEELLAQLLFGGSVTSLSATDAIQLAAALAALQGGKGLDPIGDLRRSIGLDQLRIVAADPITGQRTGVALGKYFGNRLYIELVTDGQGYSATRLEYRITSWLTLLGTVSTIGRDSVSAEISRDY
jgi:translocation and assembly module TamB